MVPLLKILNAFLPVGYGVVTLFYLYVFFRGNPDRKRSVRIVAHSVGALHLIYLILYSIQSGAPPVGSLPGAFTLLAMAIWIVYLYLEHRIEVITTGWLFFALAFVFQFISTPFIDFDRPIPEIMRSPLFFLHIATAMVGYTAFGVSAIYGVLYLMLHHELKSKRFGLIYDRLPPLDTLERFSVMAAELGFGVLSLAITAGAIWASVIFPGKWLSDPKLIGAMATWVLFGLVILGFRKLSWDGPRVALVSILGFVSAVFSMLAINLWFTEFHKFL